MYDYDSVTALAPSPESVFWVFGYGSILFKQGFAAGQTVAGRIKGWRRVFYQRSTGAHSESLKLHSLRATHSSAVSSSGAACWSP